MKIYIYIYIYISSYLLTILKFVTFLAIICVSNFQMKNANLLSIYILQDLPNQLIKEEPNLDKACYLKSCVQYSRCQQDANNKHQVCMLIHVHSMSTQYEMANLLSQTHP
jgi:hypothetical protein